MLQWSISRKNKNRLNTGSLDLPNQNWYATLLQPILIPGKLARVHGLPFFSRPVAKQRSPEKNGC